MTATSSAGVLATIAITLLAAVAAADVAPAEIGTPPPASQPADRIGPLAGLPSAPGVHLDRVKALGDDAWVNLGAPAADPKWGRALGRSWSPKMAYAPDLRGAFLAGEGGHGWVNPKTRRQMDDLWVYDINANRWICAYPGTDIANLDSAYTINADGFTATKDGQTVAVSLWGHAYECLTYDTDRRQFVGMPQAHGLYGPASSLAHRCKAAGSPWYFDPATGLWGRRPVADGYPANIGLGDVAIYVPSKKRVFFHAFGCGRNNTYFYDPATNRWTEVRTAWTMAFKQIEGAPPPPTGGDVLACYDPKRDRIYMARGKRLWYFDVKTSAWVEPEPVGEFNARSTYDATMNYDAANDRVVVICLGKADEPAGRKVFSYDPQTNTAAATANPTPKDIPQLNGFYDPVLNVHFVHAASDNREGVMWAYRFKRPPDSAAGQGGK